MQCTGDQSLVPAFIHFITYVLRHPFSIVRLYSLSAPSDLIFIQFFNIFLVMLSILVAVVVYVLMEAFYHLKTILAVAASLFMLIASLVRAPVTAGALLFSLQYGGAVDSL